MAVLVPGGPDIPDRLLRDWDDDRVVFFVGAGVSARAGLPLFWPLVEHVWTKLHGTGQKGRFKELKERLWHFPDRALGELEDRFGSHALRDIVSNRLRRHNGDIASHSALLDLSRLKQGSGHRLVTTNFDTLLEKAARIAKKRCARYVAPLLPTPRDDEHFSFSGLVYLHGRIADPGSDGRDMVLTSADFGRAYLTEGYARRFLLRLAEEFTIVFVGYRLGDPVLRYAFDALSAERKASRRRVGRPEAYIFRADNENERVPHAVTPIVYARDKGHTKLHATLAAWAAWAADPRERIREALRQPVPPLEGGQRDLVLWSVVEGGREPGFGAAEFARLTRDQLEPTPPIAWLDLMIEHERKRRAAHRARKKAAEKAGDTRWNEEAPREPVHALLAPPDGTAALPEGSAQLIPWIVSQLHEPELIRLIAGAEPSGAWPHHRLRDAIGERLRDVCPVPAALDRAWRLLASAAHRRSVTDVDLQLVDRALAEGELTPLGVGEIVRCLEPRLRLRRGETRARPIASAKARGQSDAEAQRWTLSDLLAAEVELACGIHLSDLMKCLDAVPSPGLAALAWPVTGLLEEALRLFATVERAREDRDPGRIVVEIVGQPQRVTHDWRALIVLAERAMADLSVADPRSATLLRRYWRSIRYPTFHRLAIQAEIAATVPDPGEVATWLGERDGLVMRVVNSLDVLQRLFETLWPRLRRPARSRLLAVLEKEAFGKIDRVRVLNVIHATGPGALPRAWEEQRSRLDAEVRAAMAQSWPAPVQADELAARGDEDLLGRLREDRYGTEDAWRGFIQTEPDRAWHLLSGLIGDASIPLRRAQDVLWSLPHSGLDEATASRALDAIEALDGALLDARAEIVVAVGDAVARIAQQVEGGDLDERAMAQVDRLIPLVIRHDQRSSGADDVRNIRTIDELVEVLILRLDAARQSRAAERIAAAEGRIKTLAENAETFREAIRGLTEQLPFLAFVMPDWAREHLVPAFDWSRDRDTARVAWETWLRFVLRGGKDLLEALRPHLLASFAECNRTQLSEEAQGRLAVFVVRDVVFAPERLLSDARARDVMAESTPSMLSRALQVLANDVRGLKTPGERDELWRRRLRHLFADLWPKDLDKRDPRASAQLLRLVIALDAEFPAAFNEIRDLLHPNSIRASGLLDALEQSAHPDHAERVSAVRAVLALPLDEKAWHAEILRRVEVRLAAAEGNRA